MKKRYIQFFFVIAVFCAFAAYVYAATGPIAASTAVNHGSSSFNASAYGSRSVQALAGNLTKIVMTSTSPTEIWAGLYGNVSGTVTLDDAFNWTLFAWTDLEPTGVVYAVNTTIADWTTAHCFNITNNVPNNISLNYSYDGGTKATNTTNFLTLRELEDNYNITPTQVDGVDETFNTTNTHTGFFVGDTEIITNDCATITTYQSDAYQTANYQEVLLTVNDTEVAIFATILENKDAGNSSDRLGFNNVTWDFQMLVLENGKAGDQIVTPYFMYLELK